VSTAGVALDGVDTMLAESQAAAEDRMLAHIDQRIMAIAKLIRSDNQMLADKVSSNQRSDAVGTDPELMRQTLRAVKELQAELASDVVGSMDRKFQIVGDQLHKETQLTTEAMVKVAEVLGQKMDRLSMRVDQGYGNDVQIVIDRMTEAITALSGRSHRGNSERVDI
jgi:vesicle coat complex subunit